MFLGSFLIVCGCFLYAMVKPPVPQKLNIWEEVIIPQNAAVDGEARLDV